MRTTTLAFLVLGVGLLLFLSRRQSEEVASVDRSIDYPVFVDFDPERIVSLSLDHGPRATQVRVERDAVGRWFVTDPVAYPANEDVIQNLLHQLRSARAVPAEGVDLAEAGLTPPDFVLVLEQRSDGAEASGPATRRLRLEVGAVDVDPRRCFARVPGHPGVGDAVLRLGREILVLLNQPTDEFRQPRLTPFSATSVIAFHREGALREAGPLAGEDLALDAQLQHGGWRSTDPVVSLEPVAIGALVRGAAELRAERFLTDSSEALAEYGLEPPELLVRLETDSGDRIRIAIGRPVGAPETWYARIDDQPHIVEVSGRAAQLLAQPLELLLDHRFVRVLRDDVRRVVLEEGDARLELAREADDWWVSRDTHRFPASHGRVEDLLAALERQELGEYLPGVPFRPFEPPRRITIETSGGVTWGGDVGPAYRDPATGAEGWLYRRLGDELVALVGEQIVGWFDVPLEGWRRLVVHRYDEVEVDRVRFVQGERRLEYERRNETEWFPSGVNTRLPFDSAFFPVLESVRSLRGTEWLDPGEGLELEPEVEVLLEGTFVGRQRRFWLGRTRDGRTVCRLPEGEVVAVAPELLDRVTALLDG